MTTPQNSSNLNDLAATAQTAKPSHFLRQVIEHDLQAGTYQGRHWAGQPADAATHAQGTLDAAPVRLRFPPEPNGYLHIGHAKSICLNFGLAKDYGGICHLRFDDTNPEKERQEYVDAIADAVQWLGFDWTVGGTQHLYYASNYFNFMHRAAVHLIEQGLAYVDEQTADEMRANRGDFGKPGVDSPYRNRSVAENLARFEDMRAGRLADGAAVLRAKIDMASPNINLRDPAIYRIKRAHHHNSGDVWCIYPMYTFAHPIEDALENITHSICTLEFEDQRPFYDWLLGHLAAGGLINTPPPRQYEFARLNLTYVVTSKRKLAQLVSDGHVTGWDDPRLPTLAGLRRRGYTPESLRLFAERIGVSKADSWIDYSVLEGSLRDTLDATAARALAVLDPLELVLTNWDELFNGQAMDICTAPIHPHDEARGLRQFELSQSVWIERSDFEINPPKGYHRLYPPQTSTDGSVTDGSKARLKYGHIIECTGYEADANGHVTRVLARIIPDTKSGTPGSASVKVKGVIGWVAQHNALKAEIRLYDRLFTESHPDAGGRDFLTVLNPNSLQVIHAFVEPSLSANGALAAKLGEHFQFERLGYFVADRVDHTADKPVFNQAVGLKDSWGK